MTEFTIRMANRPGKLAAVAQQLAEAGVNIEALAAYSHDDASFLRLIVDDEAAAMGVLKGMGVSFEEHKIITTMLPHRVGAVAEMAHDLAASGVNIDAMYLVHSSAEGLRFAVAVNDPDTARTQLAG